MDDFLTAAVWATSILSLVLGGVIATAFVFMATSLDLSELLNAGTEPWTNALTAIAAFIGLALAMVVGLVMWHSKRFKPYGLILVALQVALVAGACAKVYTEYF